ISLKNYPNYERKDEMLFVVAYNMYEAGQKTEAIRSYNTLIKQYPQSRFVPDAYVQMGEHFFTSNDLTGARAAFEKPASFRLPKLYPFAVYKMLEAEAPAHVRAPAWQQKILLAYDKLNKRDKVVQEMKRLVADYGPKSPWAQANAEQKGAIAEANDLAESALRELVQDYHQEAIKTKSVATYKLARDIYKQYVETFPGSETAE